MWWACCCSASSRDPRGQISRVGGGCELAGTSFHTFHKHRLSQTRGRSGAHEAWRRNKKFCRIDHRPEIEYELGPRTLYRHILPFDWKMSHLCFHVDYGDVVLHALFWEIEVATDVAWLAQRCVSILQVLPQVSRVAIDPVGTDGASKFFPTRELGRNRTGHR